MATILSCTAAKLGKARQFADPKTGFSKDEVYELCDRLLEHLPVFGTSHIGQLVTVASPRREELQNDCIEQNWSLRELKTVCKRQSAPRSRGGRRPNVTSYSVLVLLEENAETWRRLVRTLKRSPNGNQPILDRLSKKIQAPLLAVHKCMLLFLHAVAAELAVIREDG